MNGGMNALALLEFYVSKATHHLDLQEAGRHTTFYLIRIPDGRGPIARILGVRPSPWRACRVWDEGGERWIHEIWVNGSNIFLAHDLKEAKRIVEEAAASPKAHGRWAPALMMDCPQGRTAWVYSTPLLIGETLASGH